MTATLTPSKAARFADEAEALGWEVQRTKLPEGGRQVRAERGVEVYELTWTRNDRGNLVYHYGTYTRWAGPGFEPEHEEVTNVKAALRDMALRRSANGALLPFDPETSSPAEILTAVAGRIITWTNSISGLEEEGHLPRGGINLRISESPRGRVLNFADTVHTGFRAVRLNQITGVK